MSNRQRVQPVFDLECRLAVAGLSVGTAGGGVVIGVFALRALGATEMQEVYPGIAVGLAVYGVATKSLRGDDASG